ncbi:portal protein [Stenotrophomonas phage Ptah]|uniref:Portal protein n=1 Tax=Stenotrophomonas phage Ptah TaxID=2859657 RepID=A0AAE8BI06_9CAUD|nr:portal protein [Stenotrophomonas phage Ptah]
MNPFVNTAASRWSKLDGMRLNIIRRCERFAKWTIQKVFPDDSYNQNNATLSNEWQSLGAQAVNHLSNKLVMNLFAPSRPFFRLGPKKAAKKEMATIGAEQRKALENKLSVAEREAADVIDVLSMRSKLYELLKLLIITGNALMVLKDKSMRVLTMRNYAVRRDVNGKVIELMIKERIHKSELDPEAIVLAMASGQFKMDSDGMLDHYRWVTWDANKYRENQWVGDFKLPSKYDSSYTERNMPYHAVTWDLSSGNHYGTGLVEDYKNDFASFTALSQSTVLAAIMNSEFRWVLRAGAMTTAQDLANSSNGDVLYGEKDDITPLPSGMEAKLDVNITVAQQFIQRIGSAFLLQSAITRQAERVTTMELRMNAEELEGGLGGAYSRLASGLQVPLADFCLNYAGYPVNGSSFEATVITGLAALSRVGDRDRLLSFLQSLAAAASLPPLFLQRMKISTLLSDLASAEGLDRDSYVLSDEEFAQLQQQQAQAQMAQMAVQTKMQQEQ